MSIFCECKSEYAPMMYTTFLVESGGSTILTIAKGIFNCYTPGEGMDWGTVTALRGNGGSNSRKP